MYGVAVQGCDTMGTQWVQYHSSVFVINIEQKN